MMRLKVVTVVGTRPEIIRLSRLIPRLDQFVDHILVHTGQNFDFQLSDVFFRDLGLRKPDYFLNVDSTSFGTVMAETLKGSEEIFRREKPDAVMILGDTNSSVAALVAERMHIPVYHMEAGNRSFDNNVPEELNRRMVDHISSFNLPYTDYSVRNLLREGVHPRFIQKTGSPVLEIFEHYKQQIRNSHVLEEVSLSSKEFFLASIHRQENVDSEDRLRLLLEALEGVSERWKLPVLLSVHPRTRKRFVEFGISESANLIFHEPFGYFDYAKLQLEAQCVLSDSGTVSEESSVMGFPGVSLRSSMERPEALETGSTTLAGLSPDSVIAAVDFAVHNSAKASIPVDYDIPDFSSRVVSFLLSTAHLHKEWANLRKLN